ncbi:MAG: MFS transporter [Gammaproteobacteria bacterium]|nr:MFS transporter [Gammaproteobacteria bacterium]
MQPNNPAPSFHQQHYGREGRNRLVLSEHRWLRFGAFCAFYFAQGVPIGLLTIAVPAWLAQEGATVGELARFAAIVSAPWGFKLIAGPFMDRFKFLPMGFRRPWVMGAQAGLVLSFVALATVDEIDPGALVPLMVIGFVINAFSATQDVAVDGMAIDVLPEEERGRANAFMAAGQVGGYSAYGFLCGKLLIPKFGLPVTALVCALTVAAIFVLVALVRERPGERRLPWTHGEAAPRSEADGAGIATIFWNLRGVLILPMSLLLIAVEFVNRVRDGIAVAVFPKFAVDEIGMTADLYSEYISYLGLVAAVVGVVLGPIIDRAGAKRFLLFALIVSAASHITVSLLAEFWQNWNFVIAMGLLLTVSGQLVFIAIIALFMNLCWTSLAATQFSVYMALANVSRTVGGLAFAPIADRLSYSQDFLIMGGLLGLAALILLPFNQASHSRRLEQVMDSARESAGARA